MFGGKKSVVLKFCDLFDHKLDAILNDGLLYNEEQIYTAVINDNPDIVEPQYFNSWYYNGSDMYDSWIKGLHDVNEFYKIFVI